MTTKMVRLDSDKKAGVEIKRKKLMYNTDRTSKQGQ
jgi:hypothetical protein